ncbi:MAG TPA: CRTAC1 family protein [Candidatus Sulfotelmatobacter sp.]|nr:CRTAC1 family protein [Candidatus Sulfotelmatobacter sp.]
MRTRLGLWMVLILAANAPGQTARPKPEPGQSRTSAAPTSQAQVSQTQLALTQLSRTQVPQFEDVAPQAGLTVPHISSPDKKYILESMSGGVGLIDCDNDGKLDIITVNGSTVERYRRGGDPMITLYHQDADSAGNEVKFTDITKAAGLTRKGWGMGVAVADYDNDGLQDIYVTGYGGNVLYHNLGNCKFEDVTEKAGVGGGGFSTGAAWADYDRDGHVDLFVSRYVHVDMDKLPVFGNDPHFCRFKGALVQCGPWGLPGESDLLFHNKGDGTFEEVSKKAGVDDPHHYYGLGATWGDYDNDGWPDLYVANDAGPNFLYRNKHDGTFEDVGLLGGVALSGDGMQQGSMGVAWGDYLHEGRLSVLVTNFFEQGSTLYHNLGNDSFADVSVRAKINKATYPLVSWGTSFFDMDNDGWLDIFIASGHVYPQADNVSGGTQYRQPLVLFRNHRDGTFEDVSSTLEKLPLKSRRGVAFGDINNDGNVDMVVLNVGEPPSLLLNHNASPNHRVLFKLVGTKSNKAAIGARVTVKAGSLVQMDEVRGGASYISQNDLRLHFGLAANEKMQEVKIRWPNGETETLRDVPEDFIYTIVEGAGIQQKVALPPLPQR